MYINPSPTVLSSSGPSMFCGAVHSTPYHRLSTVHSTEDIPSRTSVTRYVVRPLFFLHCECNNPSPCSVWNIVTVTLHYRILYVSSAGANPRSVPSRVTLFARALQLSVDVEPGHALFRLPYTPYCHYTRVTAYTHVGAHVGIAQKYEYNQRRN